MKRILSNDDLIPEQWYWVRFPGGKRLDNGHITEPSEFIASKVKGGRFKSIMDGMWCDPQNDQALKHYEIYGPIPFPDID